MNRILQTGLLTILCSGGQLFGDVCLSYEPEMVRLTGTLTSHQGLRGWWGVKLDRPICMVRDASDPYMIDYRGVMELQLILGGQSDFDRYRPFLGGPISVTGKLTPRVTGHHETDVLIIVDKIESFSVAAGPSVAPVQTERGLPEPSSYFASVTVLPNPANRVIKQAWEKDPTDFLPESDRYIAHFFNGPKDVMWVKCREG